MPIMVQDPKWIFYKHTCNFELIKAVALDVKNNCKTLVTEKERYRMQERLTALNLYRTRNPKERPLDSINHRINTLQYWMLGYKENTEKGTRFMFSPLGNLFVNNINNEDHLRKIFIGMLFAMQFEHPGSGTSRIFQLFPFRLIFQLLCDPRLKHRLYNNEVEYLVVFIEQMSKDTYEKLIADILELRSKSNEDMKKLFKENEHVYANAVYEWEYYTLKLFESVGIIHRDKGQVICKLYHPSKANSKSKPTGRTARDGFITLPSDLKSFIQSMLEEYSCFEAPLRLDDPERLKIDVIKEIYSFYPELLLKEIDQYEDDIQTKLLELPKLIEKYSNNVEKSTAYLFEDVLTEGFNMFYNVDARKIGGAGNTDIECLYLTQNKKFAVDAKSTQNKLHSLNSGRLRSHREAIGGEYTIVVTPRYVPAVLKDIKHSSIVIIRASTFSEYLYNHIYNDLREIDYKEIDDLVASNLGSDISSKLSELTMDKFASCS